MGHEQARGFVAPDLGAIGVEPLAPLEDRVRAVLATAFRGIHHVPGWRQRKPFGEGLTVTVIADLSTFDGDYLTRLVVAAHEECVRMTVDPGGPRRLCLRFWSRMREGRLYERHPTIEQAVASVRAERWRS